MKFDHIGVVTASLDEGRAFLTRVLKISRWTQEFVDPGIGVAVQFGMGEQGPCYEIIAPLGQSSPVATALRTGKNILNHVAYLVEDLGRAAQELREQGCFPVADAQPAVAYGGQRVQFFICPMKFMIELIEKIDHQHAYQ